MQKYFQYLEVEVIFIKLIESEQMKMSSVPSFARVILAIDSCLKFDLAQRISRQVKEKASRYKLNNDNTDHMPPFPLGPVKISHKKDGCRRRLHRFSLFLMFLKLKPAKIWQTNDLPNIREINHNIEFDCFC